MKRRKQKSKTPQRTKHQRERIRQKNKFLFLELLHWFVVGCELFSQDKFHGNVKWDPEHLAAQAIIWSFQDTRNVTDAFDQTGEVCEDLGLRKTTKSYTSFMNALDAYSEIFIHHAGQQPHFGFSDFDFNQSQS